MGRLSRRNAVVVLAASIMLALPATALAESLSLSVPRTVKVHKHFRVTVRGVGASQDALNVYLDHHACARHGFDEDSRTGTKQIVLASGFHGRFSRTATINPTSTRRVFVCAYLTYPIGREIARQATYAPRGSRSAGHSRPVRTLRRAARFTG